MNDVMEIVAGLIVVILLGTPVVSFVAFMFYIRRKEKAALIKFNRLIEENNNG